MAVGSEGIKARLRAAASALRSILDGGSEEAGRPESTKEPESKPGTTYWSDSPIASPKGDLLDRVPFALRIADTLARRKDDTSLVVGVYGQWGEGKTSLLNLISSALNQHSDIITITFNPWYFRSEEILVRAFFSQLAQALGASLPTMRERAGKLLSEIGTVVSVASSSGQGIVKFGERLSRNTLEDLRARVEALLKEADRRVVVLVDDIDRLDRVEIQATFKLVKLSAGFRRLSYVLAMDDRHVAESLGEKYGAGGVEAGQQFLEKIVQVPLRVPPADPLSLRTLAFDGVNEALGMAEIGLSQEDALRFVSLFTRGCEAHMTTPRQARRYGNALMFALPALKGEANALDLLLIEAVRVFYPNLYALIRSRGDLFVRSSGEKASTLDVRKLLDGEIGKALGEIADDEKRGIRHLLEYLFPRTGSTGYGSEWDAIWAAKQRICAEDYFDRYFTYAISSRDVSDLKLTRLLDDFPKLAPDEAAQAFREVVNRDATPRAIRKLRYQEKTIASESIENLCLAIAKNGGVLPREQGLFSFMATVSQAGILVSKLVRRVPAGEHRERVACEIIEAADPLSFAAELSRWLRSGSETPQEKRILTEQGERTVGAVLARRIRTATTRESILDGERESVPSFCWIWKTYGDDGELTAYLVEQFRQEPARVPRFLLSFTGNAWGMMDGLPARADLMRDNYNAVVKLVDPGVIMGHLIELYGPEIVEAEYHDGSDLSVEENVARQFAFLHRQASREGVSEASELHEESIEPAVLEAQDLNDEDPTTA